MVGVSGVGSLPGTDLPAALRMVFDILGEVDGGVPHLPELPARGPWAGLIGRGCALLVDLPTSLDAGTWRLSDTYGIDTRRARSTLRDDVDMLQEAGHDWSGPIKLQVPGPWMLATSLLRPLGGRVLADRSARRDLAQSLAQGVADHLAEVASRLPQAQLVLQVDEPSLPAVLAGAVPTEGGYFRHRSVDPVEVIEALQPLARLVERSVLHCCADRFDPALAARASFGAVALDQALIRDRDALGVLIEGGTGLYLGCLPAAAPEMWSPDAVAERAVGLLRPLELGDVLTDRLTLTPSCGLADWSPSGAASAYRTLGRACGIVAEQLHQ